MPMIEAIYEDGRYHRTLDYKQALTPPLSAEDQKYTAERIAARG